jgi:hypothetical protein
MLDHLELDQKIRMTLLNLMVILYDCGIEKIHLGGLMRILGITNEVAGQYDSEQVLLDENFVKYVELINEPRPNDQTLH